MSVAWRGGDGWPDVLVPGVCRAVDELRKLGDQYGKDMSQWEKWGMYLPHQVKCSFFMYMNNQIIEYSYMIRLGKSLWHMKISHLLIFHGDFLNLDPSPSIISLCIAPVSTITWVHTDWTCFSISQCFNSVLILGIESTWNQLSFLGRSWQLNVASGSGKPPYRSIAPRQLSRCKIVRLTLTTFVMFWANTRIQSQLLFFLPWSQPHPDQLIPKYTHTDQQYPH